MHTVTPLFSLKHVSFLVAGKEILSGISLDIHRGEYIGVIGPNGGGKTTLLRLLLGLNEPTSGSIDVHVDRSRIGYVPQRASAGEVLFPATVEEIVESGLSHSGRSEGSQVEYVLKTTKISHLRHQRIGTLSGGERQRVMIARALVGSPEVLFLDEPTSAIDPERQEEFYTFLQELHRKGLTIVMVSHDTDAIAHEVERVLCLNKHLVCHGEPGDMLHRVKTEHYGH